MPNVMPHETDIRPGAANDADRLAVLGFQVRRCECIPTPQKAFRRQFPSMSSVHLPAREPVATTTLSPARGGVCTLANVGVAKPGIVVAGAPELLRRVSPSYLARRPQNVGHQSASGIRSDASRSRVGRVGRSRRRSEDGALRTGRDRPRQRKGTPTRVRRRGYEFFTPKVAVYRSVVVVVAVAVAVAGVRAISDFMRAYSSRAISPRA